jgi:Fe-S cluster assembly protein SufD
LGVDERGRAVFNGKAVVHQDAQKIEAHQSNRNLLLSEQAEVDTKPELEIYADDVKCSHGATVGQLDANALFYLRSRGIDQKVARGLLTFAFAETVASRIALSPVRRRVESRIARSIPEVHLTRESLEIAP